MPNVSKRVEQIQNNIMDLITDYYDNNQDDLTNVELLELAGRLIVLTNEKIIPKEKVLVRFGGIEYLVISRVLSEKEFEIHSEFSNNYLPIDQQNQIEKLQEKILSLIFDFIKNEDNNLSNIELLNFAGRLLIATAKICETHFGVVVKVKNIFYITMCHAIPPQDL